MRVNGIDCPEIGQPFGKNAKQYASGADLRASRHCDRLRPRPVRQNDRRRPSRGRQDAQQGDGRSGARVAVSEALEGQSARGARERRRGLRSGACGRDARPVAPWNWRKASREKSAARAAGESSVAAARDRSAARGVSEYAIMRAERLPGGGVPCGEVDGMEGYSREPRLLDQVHIAIRARHYSWRTEKAYTWLDQALHYFPRQATSRDSRRARDHVVSLDARDARQGQRLDAESGAQRDPLSLSGRARQRSSTGSTAS